jgi:hypothetical protein
MGLTPAIPNTTFSFSPWFAPARPILLKMIAQNVLLGNISHLLLLKEAEGVKP